MCLAIPGELKEIYTPFPDGFRMGRASFGGVVKEVNLELLPEARVGDYVLVHVGLAIARVDADEAEKTFALLREMGELEELGAEAAPATAAGAGEEGSP
ncbi:HypC/HybG/HupF family hydrogenase formation chaperone [Methylacidimicrobium sp. B4]|uniref:HypC/HybG/HupF family hydrogenase formation chaperone n=1 Tax=Methylacidimicrobium sp. B4 TaxID=2796139 RepID=UPI001A8C38D0|nr:HypC/HybG/HupF family hydrogenase formation chaperone [Methylacidimicrobium sp. B4]QSR85290.1 HypC/HybG/HupF family hydrogenase formation chaperone [Methylacidimicrobium sp. B4]